MRTVAYLTLIAFLSSCSGTNIGLEKNCYQESDPPRNIEKVNINQGLWGDVWFWSGDFMPVGRGEICQVQREILVYELTTREDVEQIGFSAFYSKINTQLVNKTTSGIDGFFQIELPVGTYSIFVKEGDDYYANSWTPIGINTVTVSENEVVDLLVNIDYEATF